MATDWTSLLGAGLNLYGANQAANQATSTANTAAQMSQFRPVGVTTRFGRSGFNYGPQGQLIGAGYQAAPDIAAMRESLLGIAGTGLQQIQQQQAIQPTISQASQGLFNLGQSFLPTSTSYSASPEAMGYADMLRRQAAMAAPSGFAAAPTEQAQQYAAQLSGIAGQALPTSFEGAATPEAQALYQQLSGTAAQVMPTSYDTQAAAQRYMQQQQALVAPQREQQLAQIRNRLQQTGRAGLATGATTAGGMAATNPEMAAYYNALAQQDAQLAANAEQQARANLQSDISLASQLGTTGLGALTGSQQQQQANALARAQFGTGLLGTGYGATTASGQQQLANALQLGQFASGQAGQALQAQQQAEELARQRMLSNLQTGTGLFGTSMDLLNRGYGLQTSAMAPFTSAFQGATALEQQALAPLDLSRSFGSAAAGPSQVAAGQYVQGQQAQQAALQGAYAGLVDPIAKLIGGLIG